MKGLLIKPLLFWLVMIVLFIPLLQQKFKFKKAEATLMGAYRKAPDTTFSASAWFSGDYSLIKEKWLQENFGLRNYYVRFNNQINWELFRKAQTYNVLNGKNDHLFEYEYISAYYGRDFVGADSLNRMAYKLKKLQDTLSKLHKLILPVLALGKASFFPEYIPDAFKSTPRVSNYLYMREKLKCEKIDHIDFNRYFIPFKHKVAVPIYPQYGIHWSSYTALLAYDSLVNYFEFKLHEDLPDLRFTKLEMSKDLRDNDFDMGDALNLLRPPKTFWMGYPEYTLVYDSLKHKKLNLLVVGDSFWFQIYNTKLPSKMFNHRFWFYNEEMYPEAHTQSTYISKIDPEHYVREADIILVLHSEGTLNRFGSGFIHSCYRYYFPRDK